ncbi:unnamed protein product [Clonostachys rosea f. rosea IK726]|uniref:Uncharacterized protein n=1 Tax=Clonostachys rosea f. rosea IK726 TaxID=1349383 RepID=A0ACA9UCJ3_BIOOC|nr:unnamed protein product [Clonostachys rosea f. rosea IK726]
MFKGTVLITGASGFLGSHIAARLIDQGYKIRATFRSESKSQLLRNVLGGKNIETCIVADITAPGAFMEAIVGADFVIHTASPFTFKVIDINKDLIQPAVEGTSRMLEAIASSSTVKRVVLTSSFAAVVDPTKGPRAGYTYTEEDWNPMTPEKALENNLFGYQASKTFAEKAAWDFTKSNAGNEKTPSLVTICPPMIFGPVHPASGITKDALNESSAQLLKAVTSADPAPTRMPVFVDVRDVAQAHVDALDVAKIPNSERFVVCAGKFTWSAIKEIYESGAASAESMSPADDYYSISPKKIEDMMGIKWISLQSSNLIEQQTRV